MSDIRTTKAIEIETVVDGNFCGGFRAKDDTNACPQLKVIKYYDFKAGIFKKMYLCRLFDYTFADDLGTRHPKCVETIGILRKSTKKVEPKKVEPEEDEENLVDYTQATQGGDSEAGWC